MIVCANYYAVTVLEYLISIQCILFRHLCMHGTNTRQSYPCVYHVCFSFVWDSYSFFRTHRVQRMYHSVCNVVGMTTNIDKFLYTDLKSVLWFNNYWLLVVFLTGVNTCGWACTNQTPKTTLMYGCGRTVKSATTQTGARTTRHQKTCMTKPFVSSLMWRHWFGGQLVVMKATSSFASHSRMVRNRKRFDSFDLPFVRIKRLRKKYIQISTEIKRKCYKPLFIARNKRSHVCLKEVHISDDSWEYSDGEPGKMGTATSLGPYNATLTECKLQCDSWTYESNECWAVAHMKDNGENYCHLFFHTSLMTSDAETIVAENFTFYRKLLWRRKC